LTKFGANIHLTPEEDESVKHLTDLQIDIFCLANDLYSFDKECAAHRAAGRTGYFLNAVHLVQHLYSLDIVAAKDKLRQEIHDREVSYCELKEKFVAEKSPGLDVLSWLGVLEAQIAGNAFAGITLPRYVDV
jgi:ophiobolin F synthase